MTLTVAYERKDFFGSRIFTEDVLENAETADVLKAFKALKGKRCRRNTRIDRNI